MVSPVHSSTRALRAVLALMLCLALVPVAPAGATVVVPKTLYVDPVNGLDTNDGLTPATAFEHIQAALNAANDGDSIELAPGTHTESDLPINVYKGVTIYGTGTWQDTVIDGEGLGTVFDISSAATVTIEDVTITGGRAGKGGGGIDVFDSSLVLTKVLVTDNLGDRGSGIYAGGSNLTIDRSLFSYNGEETTVPVMAQAQIVLPEELQCQEGGAIYAYGGSLVVRDSSFLSNGAYYAAPGIFLGGMEALVEDCIFEGNQVTRWFNPQEPPVPNAVNAFAAAARAAESGDVSAQQLEADGGAIMAIETWLEVYRSDFVDNLAFTGAGISAPLAFLVAEDCRFINNITYTGAVSTYSGGIMIGSADGGYELGSAPAKLAAQGGGSSIIDSCEFTGTFGGMAVASLDPYAYLTNSVFHHNGIYPEGMVPDDVEPMPLQTVVWGNAVDLGVNASVEADSLAGTQVINTTIADNYALYGVGTEFPGGVVRNSVIWNGIGEGTLLGFEPLGCDLETAPDAMMPKVILPETSEVASWFSEWPEFVDPEAGDYHLTGWSPCIDAGADASDVIAEDFDDVARPTDGDENGEALFDVGAFEYDPWSDTRIGGEDRYETSVEISRRHFPQGAQTVVLATGRKFADGLSSAGLAGVYDAPILLTDPLALPASVAEEIVRLGAERVVIIGQTRAVSMDVADEVAALGDIVVDRIGGVDRYETAAFVADEIVAELGDSYGGMYFVARGDLYADALTASPVAWANRVPILLVEPGVMPDATVDVITAMGGGRAVIVGGTAAVGVGVEDSARALADTVERITGSDRYDTSAGFSEWAVDGAFATWDAVGVATGEKFPDALSGGAGIGSRNGVVVLTPAESMSAPVEAVLTDNSGSITSLEVFGGEGAVSAGVYDALMAIVGDL